MASYSAWLPGGGHGTLHRTGHQPTTTPRARTTLRSPPTAAVAVAVAAAVAVVAVAYAAVVEVTVAVAAVITVAAVAAASTTPSSPPAHPPPPASHQLRAKQKQHRGTVQEEGEASKARGEGGHWWGDGSEKTTQGARAGPDRVCKAAEACWQAARPTPEAGRAKTNDGTKTKKQKNARPAASPTATSMQTNAACSAVRVPAGGARVAALRRGKGWGAAGGEADAQPRPWPLPPWPLP